jgi:predicted Zn finger-like uncharacterized protein
MIVSCPHCAARYELPPRLLGPGGARVRCPRCAASFDVGVEGAAEAGSPDPRAAGAHPAEAAGGPGPRREETARDDLGAKPRAADRTPSTPSGSAATRTHDAEPPGHAESSTEAAAVARHVLDELVGRKGPAMAEAHARGRLFSEFGPALAAAFEEFRRRSGGSGDPAPFREAVLERWGIDLAPPARRT